MVLAATACFEMLDKRSTDYRGVVNCRDNAHVAGMLVGEDARRLQFGLNWCVAPTRKWRSRRTYAFS